MQVPLFQEVAGVNFDLTEHVKIIDFNYGKSA